MFDIIRQSLKTGVVTTRYPAAPPQISARARGRPEIDWANWKDARPAAAVCPTGAISFQDAGGSRAVRLDLGKCIFCGLCAETGPGHPHDQFLRMRRNAARRPGASATYALNSDGSHERLLAPPSARPLFPALHPRTEANPSRPSASGSRSAPPRCLAVPCTSARWTPVPATVAKSKSPASTARL
jgi:ferredoxin